MSDDINIEQRVKSIEKNIDVIIGILQDFSKSISTNFTDLEDNLDVINSKIDLLHKDTNKEFGIVKSELKKIQSVTGYADQFENLKIVD